MGSGKLPSLSGPSSRKTYGERTAMKKENTRRTPPGVSYWGRVGAKFKKREPAGTRGPPSVHETGPRHSPNLLELPSDQQARGAEDPHRAWPTLSVGPLRCSPGECAPGEDLRARFSFFFFSDRQGLGGRGSSAASALDCGGSTPLSFFRSDCCQDTESKGNVIPGPPRERKRRRAAAVQSSFQSSPQIP
jgi:hypothetical protein